MPRPARRLETRTSRARLVPFLHQAAPLLAALVWMLSVAALYPFSGTFEFDPDEGIELMKARLLSEGHALYRETWSDQPPLFTHVLAGWLQVFGWHPAVGRWLVLTTAAMLMAALYRLVQRDWGHAHAVSAVILLTLSASFLPLSTAVMFVVPMHAFALLALCALLTFDGRKAWVLAASALALAISTQIKFASVILVPVFLGAAATAGWQSTAGAKRWWSATRAALIWAGVYAVVTGIAVLALIGPANLYQLIAPHETARGSRLFVGGPGALWRLASSDPWFAALGVAGLVFTVGARRWRSLVPLAWYGIAFLFLLNHRPLWSHYYLFLSVPTCWLAGIALGELLPHAGWHSWVPRVRCRKPVAAVARLATAAMVTMAILNTPAKFERAAGALASPTDVRDRRVLSRMRALAPQTSWVISSRPIVPFYAGLSVPPELSAFSLKRIHTGGLVIQDIVDAIREYRPEQIYLDGSRIPMSRKFDQALRRIYKAEPIDPPARFYTRRPGRPPR